jgi:N6-L-threonylcarbamoyladenine synthase
MTHAMSERDFSDPDVPLTVLAVESSCDETAAAVVRVVGDRAEVRSDVVWSQVAEHAP